MPTPILLTPISINRLTLPNRFIMPGMVTNHAAVNGEVTEKLIHYHTARAKGGVGLNPKKRISAHLGATSAPSCPSAALPCA